MLMFSRNGSATKDISGSNSAHATPQHHYHRLSTSSAAAMMSPRGVFLSANSSSNSQQNGYINRFNGRKSYCDPSGGGGYALSSISSKGQPPNVVDAVKGQQQNGTNCPPNEDRSSASVFKRSTSRSTMKKNRPHSWHSTLQRGFNRARSRSTGRGEREQRKEEKEQQANSSNSKSKGRK